MKVDIMQYFPENDCMFQRLAYYVTRRGHRGFGWILKTSAWNSPDLNQIENIWGIMKAELRKQGPLNQNYFKHNKFSSDTLQNLFD